jgi:hypothetical protein
MFSYILVFKIGNLFSNMIKSCIMYHYELMHLIIFDEFSNIANFILVDAWIFFSLTKDIFSKFASE